LLFLKGRYVGWGALSKTVLPFVIFTGLGLYFFWWQYLVVWFGGLMVGAMALAVGGRLVNAGKRGHRAGSGNGDGDAELTKYGPPPYCWSSIGPDAFCIAPLKPHEYLVRAP
jgi:hypothetical protein